ncbi:MAG TPA: metallophosphoesterase [Pyrinomonadaceae bacterium]|nr:metallophosphoesterase [Pyrinomonadaceae bacterium]
MLYIKRQTPMALRNDKTAAAEGREPLQTPQQVANLTPPSPATCEQLPMVGWYDPRQLIRTGLQVAISTIFGRHSDRRLVEALASGKPEIYDYTHHYRDDGREVCELDETRPRDEIWIDYVADTGEGWNSTYGVAYHLAQDSSELEYADAATGVTRTANVRRGDVFVFGGDQVYPAADRVEYDRRLVKPYEHAYPHAVREEHPHLFAIPGNHDWYDSLISFSRLFCSKRWFSGWRTRQSRSYFALKLPHGWWLLGTDMQLGSDIDAPQVEYFKSVAAEIKETDRIILCHAEPHWIYSKMYEHLDSSISESNLSFLEEMLGKKVAVFIAGDLHHYRRHEATDESSTQKITAGGGGAFLHPTHSGRFGTDVSLLREESSGRVFQKKVAFPPEKVSRRLCWRNLVFPFLPRNQSWSFGFLTAALYLLTTLAVVADFGHIEETSTGLRSVVGLKNIIGTALHSVLNSPLTLFFVLLTVLGFVLFTDTHSKLYRWVMGGGHGLAHIISAFAVALGSVSLVIYLSSRTSRSWVYTVTQGPHVFNFDLRTLLAAVLVLVGGYLVGSLIQGLYLLVSLNVFGRHFNEAFSTIAVEDWKSFLKLRIDRAGDLAIYPVGIRRVPRAWRRSDGDGARLVPDLERDPRATPPALIEPPIVLKRTTATATGVVEAKKM